MNYYQFHISDWALHTSHLTLEEEGVYRRLLDYYYDTELPIPEETQSVIRRLRLGSYSVIVGLILEEFFVLKDGFWHNLRADFEISEYHKKVERAKENGKKGGRPKKNNQQNQQVGKSENPEKTESVSVANPEKSESKANQEPLTINHNPVNNNNDHHDDFDEFWDRYPKKVGKKAARTSWKRLNKESKEIALGDCEARYAGTEKQFIPNPSTYLNGERWNDEKIVVGGTKQPTQTPAAMKEL